MTTAAKVLVGAVVVLGVGLVAVMGWLIVLDQRIEHMSVRFPRSGGGDVYLIIGSDSRSNVGPGLAGVVGAPQKILGQHADVVILVTFGPQGPQAVAVPRDLLVSPRPYTEERLALSFENGPQGVVDGLCRTLGVRVDHVVVARFSSFDDIVRSIGGIDLRFPSEIQDPNSELHPIGPGIRHLDAPEALALVRSRTPLVRMGASWSSIPNGAVQRTDWTAKVFHSILQKARANDWNPIVDFSLAWSISGGLSADNATGLVDLVRLAEVRSEPFPLFDRKLNSSIAAVPGPQDQTLLKQLGFPQGCKL